MHLNFRNFILPKHSSWLSAFPPFITGGLKIEKKVQEKK